jgi:hypothetical protein
VGMIQLEYAHRISPASSFSLGGWTSGALLRAGNELGSHVEVVSAGPQTVYRPPAKVIQFTATAGLGGMVSLITIDENIAKRSYSVGGRVSLRVERRVSETWSAGMALGFEPLWSTFD